MTDMDKMMIDGVMVAFDIYLRRLHYERRLSQKRVDEDRELFRAVVAQYVTAYNPDDRRREALERIKKLEAALGYSDDLPKQLLRDADEMEACGAGNEAANMRKLVSRLLDARAALSPLPQATK